MPQVNEHGLYVEPTYIPGGYKQSMRVTGEPWGYGSHSVQPGTYQLDAGGMVPASTLGGVREMVQGGGIAGMALGAGFAWVAWKVTRQAFGGAKAPNWAAGLIGGLALLGGATAVLGGAATMVDLNVRGG